MTNVHTIFDVCGVALFVLLAVGVGALFRIAQKTRRVANSLQLELAFQTDRVDALSRRVGDQAQAIEALTKVTAVLVTPHSTDPRMDSLTLITVLLNSSLPPGLNEAILDVKALQMTLGTSLSPPPPSESKFNAGSTHSKLWMNQKAMADFAESIEKMRTAIDTIGSKSPDLKQLHKNLVREVSTLREQLAIAHSRGELSNETAENFQQQWSRITNLTQDLQRAIAVATTDQRATT